MKYTFFNIGLLSLAFILTGCNLWGPTPATNNNDNTTAGQNTNIQIPGTPPEPELGTPVSDNKNTNDLGSQNTNIQLPGTPPAPELPTPITPPKYSLADIAKHNTASDCWVTITGKVFNITNFIPNHKGGPGIAQACGTDANAVFDAKHSPDKLNLVQSYYIGDLK